jgi:hypothetical protein
MIPSEVDRFAETRLPVDHRQGSMGRPGRQEGRIVETERIGPPRLREAIDGTVGV